MTVAASRRAHPCRAWPSSRAFDQSSSPWRSKGRANRRPSSGGNEMIAEETTPDVAGDCRDDHLSACAMEGGSADDDGRTQLSSRLVSEHEAHEDDIASPTENHTRRLSSCPTTQRAPGPPAR